MASAKSTRLVDFASMFLFGQTLHEKRYFEPGYGQFVLAFLIASLEDMVVEQKSLAPRFRSISKASGSRMYSASVHALCWRGSLC